MIMSTATISKAGVPAMELPDDPPLFEIIDGKIVELPPMSSYAVRIASNLAKAIAVQTQLTPVGEAVVEQIFNLRLSLDRNRRPDVAFVSYERWPQDRPQPMEGDIWDVVPDLMVEVISPSDKAEELLTKIREYFEAGARQVWVIYPRERLAYLYESPVKLRIIADGDELSGGDVIPGFQLTLARLFPPALTRDGSSATNIETNGSA
jgi:Uma2 family endonuclease